MTEEEDETAVAHYWRGNGARSSSERANLQGGQVKAVKNALKKIELEKNINVANNSQEF